ncbi:hypothetical protein ScPMuIL_015414 [Solemya velum]
MTETCIFVMVFLSCCVVTWAGKSCTAPAPLPGQVEAANTAEGATVRDGATLTYTCDTGYTANVDSGVITCNDGTFPPRVLRCTGDSCTAADPPAGMVEAASTAAGATVAHGDTLTYSCDTGYTGNGDSGVITCHAGVLPSVSLRCTGDPCTAPTPTTGSVEAASTAAGATVAHGETLTYSCDTGFTGNGQSGVITCNTGSFPSVSLRCTGCAAPALLTGMSRSPATAEGAVVADTNTLVYSCLSGYTASGSDQTITCGTNTWSSSITLTCSGCAAPTLDPKMIRTPTTVDGAVVANAGTLVYTCKPGYTKSGDDQTTTCNTNAWDSTVTLTCSGAQGMMGYELYLATGSIIVYLLKI